MKRDRSKRSIRQHLAASPTIPWLLLMLCSLGLTLTLYPNLMIKRHVYQLGDVAQRDVKAPVDFFVVDTAATDTKKEQAADAVLKVYDHNRALGDVLTQNIERVFAEWRRVFPKPVDEPPPAVPATGEEADGETLAEVEDRLWQMKGLFEEKLGIPVSNGAYRILISRRFSAASADTLTHILQEIMDNGVAANKELLLREGDKGVSLRDIDTKNERIIHNLRRFYGLDQAKTMVRIIGQPLLKDESYTLRNLVVDFAQRMIQPNITLNQSETEERRRQAAEKIKPIMYQIKAGEMLLREGERVTQQQLLKLRTLAGQVKSDTPVAGTLGAAVIMGSLIVVIYTLCLRSQPRFQRNRNINLLFLTCLVLLFLFGARVWITLAAAFTHETPFGLTVNGMLPGIPLASGAMTVCLFMGLEIAVATAAILSIGVALIFQNRLDLLILFLCSGAMGAYWLMECRERKVFITAGLKLGLLNILLVTALNTYTGNIDGLRMAWNAVAAFMGGFIAGIVTAGLAPLVEIAFGYTTDITLLELANLDRPILKRLMIEAPGTYHHSMVVGSMVEAAATEIGANPLLAKVCAYYHDIGKLTKPLYFIENQRNGKNPHDKLAPAMSKRILVAHVKDGVELACKEKLGQNIIDVIRQSHGTSLISFFYNKARKQKGDGAVKEDDFRYPGPRPQTREAGLVMLADVVEAASRTLENPTPSRIQGHVQALINKVFSEGQLSECELTLKDLNSIAKSFIKILNGIHHHRVDYPTALANGKEKRKNGHSDRQSTRSDAGGSGNDAEEGPNRLKRLGLS